MMYVYLQKVDKYALYVHYQYEMSSVVSTKMLEASAFIFRQFHLFS